MNKINVLIFLTASAVGGAERVVLDTVSSLNKHLFKMHVITLRQGDWDSRFSDLGVPYFCGKAIRGIDMFFLVRLIRYIRQKDIQVVHCHLIEADLYIPFVKIFCPGVVFISTRHNTSKFRQLFWGRFLSGFINLPFDRILAVSEEVKNYACRYELFCQSKITVLFNGVDTEKFYPVKVSNLDLKRAKEKLIVFVGRLHRYKNPFGLIPQALKLSKIDDNFRFLVVGDGKIMADLKRKIADKNLTEKFTFLGFRQDLADIYSQADLAVFLSEEENFNLCLLEAMSCEIPVLVIDTPSVRRIVPDNLSGLFRATDLDDLSSQLEKALLFKEKYGPAKTLRQWVVDNFSINFQMKKLERIYKESISNP